VITSGLSPRYIADGYLVYVQAPGKLLATDFDASRGTLRGTPVVLADNLRTANYSVAQFTVAQKGMLIYASGPPQGLTEFVWVDRTGKTKPLGLPQDVYEAFALSEDGSKLAYTVNGEIWIYDLLRHITSRLTPRVATGMAPICVWPRWTRDSKHVLYARRPGDSTRQLIWASLDGTPEITLWSQKDTGPAWLYPMGFSPDGSVLSVFGLSKDNSFDLFLVHLNGVIPLQGEPELFLGKRFGECFGQISPDGHWMLFSSDQSGEYEVYITSYPKPGPIYQVSKNGGREPLWNPGAAEIDYLNGTQMYAVDVNLGRPSSHRSSAASFRRALSRCSGFRV
jgi:eukaryotic-like serine/threonine-protein kinase